MIDQPNNLSLGKDPSKPNEPDDPEDTTREEEAKSDQNPPQEANKPPRKRTKRIIIAGLIIILAVIVISALLAWLVSVFGTDDTKPRVTKQPIDQLNIAIGDDRVDHLYPEIPLSTTAQSINMQVFEGLVRWEDRSKLVPSLAIDWNNPDDTTWVFNLKRNVKFHSGRTMTARDVKYSIELIQKDYPDLNSSFTSSIKSVRALSDYKVEISTDGPDPVLLNKLASVFILDSNLEEPGGNPTLAGTGPYLLRPGTQPNQNLISLIAASDYHGGEVLTKQINFYYEPKQDDLINGLKNGRYNIIGTIRENNIGKAGSKAREFVTRTPEVAYLGFNTNEGPLQSLTVRRAVSHALDPKALAKKLGYEIRLEGQIIPREIPGHNPAIERRAHDPALSRELLRQAGYSNGLEITLTHGDTAPGFFKEMKRQMAQAGITLKEDFIEDLGSFIDDIIEGNTQMYYITFTSDLLDGSDILEQAVLHSDNYENEFLASLVDQAGKTLNSSARLQTLQQASQIVYDDIPVAPSHSRDRIWLMDQPYVIKQDTLNNEINTYLSKVHLLKKEE